MSSAAASRPRTPVAGAGLANRGALPDPHSEWSIHSGYQDNLFLLSLSRGGPTIWISPADAAAIGARDNDWIEAVNRNGVIVARAVASQKMPARTVSMYQAQERVEGTDLYAAQRRVFLDPDDPAVQAAAERAGIPRDWVEAAQRSPVRGLIGQVRGRAAAAPGVPDDADGLVHPAAVAAGRPVRPARDRLGSPLFHFGILLVLLGHVGGILVPHQAFDGVGVHEHGCHLMAMTIGGIPAAPARRGWEPVGAVPDRDR